MMKTAVGDALVPGSLPRMGHESPETRAEAVHILLASSNEARCRNADLLAEGSGFKAVDSFPRMPECYGWLNFTDLLFNLDRRVQRQVLPLTWIRVGKVDRMFLRNSTISVLSTNILRIARTTMPPSRTWYTLWVWQAFITRECLLARTGRATC